jgi:hypothetical protein
MDSKEEEENDIDEINEEEINDKSKLIIEPKSHFNVDDPTKGTKVDLDLMIYTVLIKKQTNRKIKEFLIIIPYLILIGKL